MAAAYPRRRPWWRPRGRRRPHRSGMEGVQRTDVRPSRHITLGAWPTIRRWQKWPSPSPYTAAPARRSSGVSSAGRYHATIVLSHGYGGDQDEMLPVANTLHAAGFTVVTYNERGRGGSTGQGTWGALETQDLRSVIDTVVRHPDVDPDKSQSSGFLSEPTSASSRPLTIRASRPWSPLPAGRP